VRARSLLESNTVTLWELDWTHLYIWIAKDLSWTQNWFSAGCIAAVAAFCVSCLCVARAWWAGAATDTFVHCMTFLWLFANAVWMYGEIRDANFPGQPLLYEKCRSDASVIMLSTLVAMVVYYIQRCRQQFCSDVSGGSDHVMRAVHLRSSGDSLHAIQVPPPSSASGADYHADDADDADEAPARLDDHVGTAESCQQQPEPLPRPFMRSIFPTWRSYEHVHVSVSYA
jgi:hypothetical protein